MKKFIFSSLLAIPFACALAAPQSEVYEEPEHILVEELSEVYARNGVYHCNEECEALGHDVYATLSMEEAEARELQPCDLCFGEVAETEDDFLYLSEEDNFLMIAAEGANAICPQPIDEFTTLVAVDYDPEDKRFLYKYDYKESNLSLQALKNVGDKLAAQIIENMSASALSSYLRDLVKDAGGYFDFMYVGETSGDRFSVLYFPSSGTYQIR